jgi:hypothetical protein
MIVPVKGVAAMQVDLTGIDEGDPLALVAEPENQYDSHAIRVEHDGRRIGYLDRNLAARITADTFRASVAAVLFYEGEPKGLRIFLNRGRCGSCGTEFMTVPVAICPLCGARTGETS